MSTLAENVKKVVDAHAGLKTALESKGVEVPEGAKLSDMPALVSGIETREPQYQARSFSFNGWYQGENFMDIQTLDATKPFTIDPTSLVYYADMFHGCFAKHIIIPQLVGSVSIYTSMFEDAVLLKSIEFPDGFGQYATNCDYMFRNCTNLPSLELPENFAASMTKAPLQMIAKCQSLKRLKFGNGCFGGVTSFSSSVMGGCESLMTVEFDAGAMENLSSLTLFVNNASGLTHIGNSVISSIVMPEGFGKHITKFKVSNTQVTELLLPDSMGSLATTGWDWDDSAGMVKNCPELTCIRLPQGKSFKSRLIYDTPWAFQDCPKLRRVVLPSEPYYASCRISGACTMWSGCNAVEEVVGTLYIYAAMTTYAMAYKLDVSHMQSLTHDSLMVFVNGLNEIENPTAGSTFTFTLGATNLAKLTDEEKAIATGKGWTLA